MSRAVLLVPFRAAMNPQFITDLSTNPEGPRTVAVLEPLTTSVTETATVPGVSLPTVYRLLARGLIRPLPGVRHKRVPERQVHAFIEGLRGVGRRRLNRGGVPGAAPEAWKQVTIRQVIEVHACSPSLGAVASGRKNRRLADRMNTVEQVEAEIRRLPRKARQQVAERLNAQLWPSGFAPEVETAWADTVKRRLDDLDSGRVQGVPAAQVFARARRLLTRR